MDDFNNHDEKGFENLIKDLKSLQKIKAPKDFEYKLMVKIQNGQFESSQENHEKKWKKMWVLIPAFSLTATAIIIFNLFSINSNNSDNPFQQEPMPRKTFAVNESKNGNQNNRIIVKSTKGDKHYVESNDVIRRDEVSPLLSENAGVSLELNANSSKSHSRSNPNLVVSGGVTEDEHDFIGFFSNVSPEERKVLDALIRRKDSLLKVQPKKLIK